MRRSAARACPWLRLPPLALAAACGLAACSPALDWREMPVESTGLTAVFPCRPSRFERPVIVGTQHLTLFLLSCEAGGQTFGVATAELDDPGRVNPVLEALALAAASGIGAPPTAGQAYAPTGATPNPRSVQVDLQGRRPDGSPVRETVLLFARGTRVFQATVIGSELPATVLAPFRDGLRFSPAT